MPFQDGRSQGNNHKAARRSGRAKYEHLAHKRNSDALRESSPVRSAGSYLPRAVEHRHRRWEVCCWLPRSGIIEDLIQFLGLNGVDLPIANRPYPKSDQKRVRSRLICGLGSEMTEDCSGKKEKKASR
jgi:hypothetical protein